MDKNWRDKYLPVYDFFLLNENKHETGHCLKCARSYRLAKMFPFLWKPNSLFIQGSDLLLSYRCTSQYLNPLLLQYALEHILIFQIFFILLQ